MAELTNELTQLHRLYHDNKRIGMSTTLPVMQDLRERMAELVERINATNNN